MFLLQVLQPTQDASPVSNPVVFAALISASALLIVNIVTQILQIRSNNRTHEHNKKVLADKKLEEKRKEIYKKLDDFYGPFQQYLGKSSELYQIFIADKPADFRALTYFLDRTQLYDGKRVMLTENDRAIFAEILSVGKQLEKLVLSKAGLVDDPTLRQDGSPATGDAAVTDVSRPRKNGLLAVLTTHLFVIRLAYEEKLTGQIGVYKNYVFPRELPPIIEDNIARLNQELNTLNGSLQA